MPNDRVDIAQFVAALPKTELHLHLVGSAAPETVLTLARRHPDGGVPTEPEALRQFYAFTSPSPPAARSWPKSTP